MPDSALYLGQVMHQRLRPMRHRFVYRVFSLLLDLDDLPALARRLRLLSYNRFNLFSFHDRDHGPRDGTALRPWVARQLAASGIEIGGGRILIHCFPRVLGYVFNPLSLYWCYGPDGRLRAVLCEVKNTFGQQHAYTLRAGPAQASNAVVRAEQDKAFYVSPFIDMAGRYRFRLKEPGERLSLLITESEGGAPLLVATHTARRAPLRDRALLRAFISFPLLTLKVIAGIHWEALKLWHKGARFHPRPVPPTQGETSS